MSRSEFKTWGVVLVATPFDYGVPRNPDWEARARAFLKANRQCVACGRPATQVHHVYPFHLFPELEMVEEHWRAVEPVCHLAVGHLGDWSLWERQFDRYSLSHLKRVAVAITRKGRR